MIYLDNAATTLIKPVGVSDACGWAVNNLSSPSRGAYESAMSASKVLYDCREKLSKYFNVKAPENIVFTSNATHALNIAIKDLAKRGTTVAVSGYEHNAVIRPLVKTGANLDIVRSRVFSPKETLDGFYKSIKNGAALVVCTHVSNVFGYILPVYEIASMCREKDIPIIIDASQSAGVLKIDADALDAAYIAMPGHKGLMGPQGTGVLICKQTPDSLIEGGTGSNSIELYMPDFLPDASEAGTHNMPGIAGLSAAMDFHIEHGCKKIYEHEKKLIAYAVNRLLKLPQVKTYYSNNLLNQSGVLSFTVKNRPCTDIAEALSQKNIALRAGLHCAPTAHQTVGTLKTGTIRLSVSFFNSFNEVLSFCSALKEVLVTNNL